MGKNLILNSHKSLAINNGNAYTCICHYIIGSFFYKRVFSLNLFYKVLIEAVDNGQPPQSNRKTVTVTVPRDASPPNFQNLPVTITIDETRPIGDSVYIASATDNWRVSC